MLVLSRQRDETIMIGDDIEITIVDIRGDKVRLGITAPATIPVHRKEVYDAIQRENREAARMKMEDIGSLPKAGRPSVPPGLHRPPPGVPPSASPGGATTAPGTSPGTSSGVIHAAPATAARPPAVRPAGPGAAGGTPPANGSAAPGGAPSQRVPPPAPPAPPSGNSAGTTPA